MAKYLNDNDKGALVQLILSTIDHTTPSTFKMLGVDESGAAGKTLKGGQFDSLVAKSDAATTINVGAVGATYGTVVEKGNGNFHKTTITLDGAFSAIAGGADLAVGRLIYTFPAGVVRINSVFLNGLALQQTEGNVTADTPDVGLGTTIASGAVDVLGGTAAFENVLTGQTFTDCDGTAERVGAASTLVLTAADDHTLHLNVADGWAASGDVALGFTGDIVITWEFLS